MICARAHIKRRVRKRYMLLTIARFVTYARGSAMICHLRADHHRHYFRHYLRLMRFAFRHDIDFDACHMMIFAITLLLHVDIAAAYIRCFTPYAIIATCAFVTLL